MVGITVFLSLLQGNLHNETFVQKLKSWSQPNLMGTSDAYTIEAVLVTHIVIWKMNEF
jgi:hypothetical protein